jgi:hypothetical protein
MAWECIGVDVFLLGASWVSCFMISMLFPGMDLIVAGWLIVRLSFNSLVHKPITEAESK